MCVIGRVPRIDGMVTCKAGTPNDGMVVASGHSLLRAINYADRVHVGACATTRHQYISSPRLATTVCPLRGGSSPDT